MSKVLAIGQSLPVKVSRVPIRPNVPGCLSRTAHDKSSAPGCEPGYETLASCAALPGGPAFHLSRAQSGVPKKTANCRTTPVRDSFVPCSRNFPGKISSVLIERCIDRISLCFPRQERRYAVCEGLVSPLSLRGLDLPIAFDAGERARACAAKSPAGAVRLYIAPLNCAETRVFCRR